MFQFILTSKVRCTPNLCRSISRRRGKKTNEKSNVYWKKQHSIMCFLRHIRWEQTFQSVTFMCEKIRSWYETCWSNETGHWPCLTIALGNEFEFNDATEFNDLQCLSQQLT